MRLIDADKLLKDMDKELETCEDYGITPSWWTAYTIIKNQKTAYDVDKVVDQIEFLQDNSFQNGIYDTYQNAIEIIKAGVNE